MVNGKKVIVVLPANNATKTLEMTYKEIPFAFADDVDLVDDASWDGTGTSAHERPLSASGAV